VSEPFTLNQQRYLANHVFTAIRRAEHTRWHSQETSEGHGGYSVHGAHTSTTRKEAPEHAFARAIAPTEERLGITMHAVLIDKSIYQSVLHESSESEEAEWKAALDNDELDTPWLIKPRIDTPHFMRRNDKISEAAARVSLRIIHALYLARLIIPVTAEQEADLEYQETKMPASAADLIERAVEAGKR
jgi:hypothetical protein